MTAVRAMSAHRNPKTAIPRWHVVDAEGYVVGRLAKQIAPVLVGKHKPTYHPAYPTGGDYVVVVNAEKIQFAAKKLDKKVYRWHTGWPGGLKEKSAKKMMEEFPDRILRHAVKGMLPVNNLREERLARLKIYAGPDHPHAGQVATTPADMKRRWIRGPTKHPVINAYEKPGLLFELEDKPDEWNLWLTQIDEKPEVARKIVEKYLTNQTERRAKLREQLLKTNPEQLLGADGRPLFPAKAAAKPPADGKAAAKAAPAKPAPGKK